jgi:Glycosyl transferases group 1
MACGTPVIAFRAGSVPEVIDAGITGFVVEAEEEAVQAIQRLDKLSRYEVRAQFERRFTAERMAQDYVAHYGALISIKPEHRAGSAVQEAGTQLICPAPENPGGVAMRSLRSVASRTTAPGSRTEARRTRLRLPKPPPKNKPTDPRTRIR